MVIQSSRNSSFRYILFISSKGLSYNGEKDSKPSWDRVQTCNVDEELSHDLKYKVDNWNMSV